MNTTAPKHTNRLAREKSPYLLQHAHNPVDWYAWGDEAFARARAENKPIFLSIGYSTCHWCHVMERESFEDEKVAEFLNRHFISIKVDREERPDVDKIYMTFVQSTIGSGGWPLNVFLIPDRRPFFGGTYFPPDNRYGRSSFGQLLEQIAKVWQERHDEVLASAEEIHARLELATTGEGGASVLTADTLLRAGAIFKEAHDPKHGGFGAAPKFPQPGIPLFLLRYGRRFADKEAAGMVLHTCDAMARGGIHDQLGGGFARYSVDAEWLVPHFEKMLYDNAQLAQLYLDAFLVSGEARHADVVRDILDYVLHDMTHPEGGFYSAEDADSEGHEGRFYCWTEDELSKLLAPEEFKLAVRYFGITKEGNFVDHSHPTPLTGQNVLSIAGSLTLDSYPADGNKEAVRARDLELLASAKRKMSEARAKRVRPHLDDKVLASWNGLMLGAFARAYAVLGDEAYRAAAEKNLAFLRAKLWVSGVSHEKKQSNVALPLTPALSPGERENSRQGAGEVVSEDDSTKGTGTLYHRWRDGERDQVQLLEGYAFLLDGALHLYEATLVLEHLDFAIALAESMIAGFYDPKDGGFWQSVEGANDLILRVKDDYDGAEPSGNSVATIALLKLAAITGRDDFRQAAAATLRLFSQRLQKFPHAMPHLLQAVDFSIEEPLRAVIAGGPNDPKARELLRAIHSVYQPNKVVLGNVGPVEDFARTLPAKGGPVVYICSGHACQAPTNDASVVKENVTGSPH